MQLDSSRNHIIMVNLWLSMLNISVMATTIVPAFFGMNLASGLSETEPALFYLVREHRERSPFFSPGMAANHSPKLRCYRMPRLQCCTRLHTCCSQIVWCSKAVRCRGPRGA
jgi:hypothetical protein